MLHALTRRRLALTLGLAVLLVAIATAGLLALSRQMPLPERLHTRDSVVVSFHDGRPAHVFLSSDDRWRIAAPLAEVDPGYVDALLRLEDKRFREHGGVDLVAIARAAWLNLTSGRRVSGASTITMQLVRILEPRPRTYRSKVVEAFRAWQIERHLSKDEILEAYLRFAPFGRNIEGVEAASIAYFGHRADALSPAEIATLLAVPQNPNGRYPRPDHVEVLRDARDGIAAWLLEEAALDDGGEAHAERTSAEILADVEATDPPDGLRPFPRQIPHLAYWLRAKHPDQDRLETTIDAGLQRIVERSLEGRREENAREGIHNASVVVVDHENGAVRALVGNTSFDANGRGSQIAAFDVPRSPGSLLKPLIYAEAISKGLAHPWHLVEDAPVQIGAYAPTNFDGGYDGLVRLEDALARSLNVPFVHLLAEVGVENFIGALRSMGAAHLAEAPGHYGLSAAIGGVETTPLEIAGIYATLARGGRWVAPALLERDVADAKAGLPIVTPGAAWLTRRTLEIRERPDFAGRRRFNPRVRQLHWKTGTSYGNLDAWAAGGGARFSAVVWLGNLDRTPSSALVGGPRAAPLLFDVLEAIEPPDARADRRPTDDLIDVEVCAYSGRLPTKACPSRKTVHAYVRAVPTERCPYHRLVDVDDDSGLALTPECRAGRDYTTRSYVVWPASVRRHLEAAGQRTPQVPRLADGCSGGVAGAAPAIISPPHGQAIVLMPGVAPERQEVALEANGSHAGQTLSWFVDGVLLAEKSVQETAWWTPSPGRHEIVVQDAAGRADRRVLVVK